MNSKRLPLLMSSSAEKSSQPVANAAIDCVIVGYNDLDFDTFATVQRKMGRFSGAYLEAKTNSVILNGRRITYMELLNQVIMTATGRDPALNAFNAPSLGACHLANFLRKRDFTVEIVNLFNSEKQRFAELLALNPNLVAITTTYYVDPAPIIELIKFIRSHNLKTKIVIGGPFIFNTCTVNDQETRDYVLGSIGADYYVVDAQGMAALALLVRYLRTNEQDSITSIPNLIYPNPGGGFTENARIIEDLNLDDNSIDWDLFPREQFFKLPIYMRTAISCPFACSFCSFPAMAGEHRVANVETVERELLQLHSRGVRQLVFVDDTFNVPLPRFKSILRMMIRNKFDFSWFSFFRCSNADDEVFDLMKDSGCWGVFLGIESGAPEILKNMNKFAKIDRYSYGIDSLKKRGIMTYASIIIGFPGETKETINQTMRFLEDNAPDLYNLQLYYHDVRTPIHEEASKYNIRGAGYSWSHASMNWKEASGWVEHMYRNIRNSIPLTLYGFSIWCMAYLLSSGLNKSQILEFVRHARELLILSLDERDSRDRIAALAEILRPLAQAVVAGPLA